MEIKLAKFSGFCFGVKNAVDTAYRILEEYKDKDIPLYMLGELTHNDIVVSDLLAKGFKLINKPEEATENSLVLLRAHGVTTDVYDVLSRKNCKVIDCTCPFVSKIHKIVEKATKEGKNIIVTGTKGHPEVVGICSRAPEDKVYVISNVDEIDNIPFDIELDVEFPNTSRGEVTLDTEIDSQYIFEVNIRIFHMETGRLFVDQKIPFPDANSCGMEEKYNRYYGNYASVLKLWEQYVGNIYETFVINLIND